MKDSFQRKEGGARGEGAGLSVGAEGRGGVNIIIIIFFFFF